jgi:hypothetical protein
VSTPAPHPAPAQAALRQAGRLGRIFRNPASGIMGGTPAFGVIVPLDQAAYDRAIQAATQPAARLMLALAAMHAARPHAIRHLLLTDIDLGDGRITIGGHTRPLDPTTRAVVLGYLAHRRTRWPTTANPHLLVTRSSASGRNPSSHPWIKRHFTGLTQPSNRCASTANSKKPCQPGQTHSTSPPYSASAIRPQSATLTQPASYSPNRATVRA